MFRSLATRLVALYVFAAIGLVLLVSAAIAAFTLSVYGLSATESIHAIQNAAADEVRVQTVQKHRTLEQAADDIVRQLARPGVRIAVSRSDGDRIQVLAVGIEDGHIISFNPRTGGPPLRVIRHRSDERESRGERAEDAGGPGSPPPGPRDFHGPHFDYDHPPPLPFGLNLILRIPRASVDVPGGRVAIFADPRSLSSTVNDFSLLMLPLAVFAVIVAWFVGRYITDQALRPLVETTAALNRFGAGDFTPRPVVASGSGEIVELVSAYNLAVAQVSAAFEERRRAETYMRQFVADAGHELRTPLTVIMGFIDVLRRRPTLEGEATQRIFGTMLTESRRMRALIDKLIVLARLENPATAELGTLELGELARRVIASLESLHAGRTITVEAPAPLYVLADESEMYEALSNLIENALKYAPQSPVDVSLAAENGSARIDVVDHGPGLEEVERERVFDRFYRGANRGDSEGFGLGLAIVKRAVERAAGSIEVSSAAGGGARFTIHLPREDADAPEDLAVHQPARA